MDWKKKDINSFLREIQDAMGDAEGESYDPAFVNNFPLNKHECLYVFDLKANDVIHHRGFDKVFGHENDKIGIDFIFDKYHPDDAPLVKRVVKACVSQFLQKPIPKLTNLLNVSYRFQRADGTYANVLSNTIVLDTDREGHITRVLLRYTDISFTESSDAVDWEVNGDYIETFPIHDALYGDESHSFFTNRELEVIAFAVNSKSNAEIAKILNISSHTVATHRKNILFKSGCHNFVEVSDFCRRNGISYDLE
jgi:DNA-binding CsgD family transcriptional regulator